MKIFSERLKEARKAQKRMQKDMAELLNMTVRGYQYYEDGSHEPSYDDLVLLAKYLNVSTDYLLGLKD